MKYYYYDYKMVRSGRKKSIDMTSEENELIKEIDIEIGLISSHMRKKKFLEKENISEMASLLNDHLSKLRRIKADIFRNSQLKEF